MKRPIEFKIRALELYRQGMAPIDAFRQAGEEMGIPLSGCMTDKRWAPSYMSDDIKGFLRKKASSDDALMQQVAHLLS